MSSNELAVLKDDVLHIVEADNPEEVMDLWEAVVHFEREAKALKALMKEQILAWMDEKKTSIEHGGLRYYSGTVKKWSRTKELRAFVEEILDLTGGDIDLFVKCLSTAQSTFKHGEVRELEARMGKTNSLFYCAEVEVLKEGKLTKKKEIKTIPIQAGGDNERD